MSYDKNPFAGDDIDRAELWDMLVHRDIDAFLAADWSMVEADFLADEFFGVDAGKSRNADDWKPGFPDLATYRDEWLRQAVGTQKTADMDRIRAALFSLTDLSQIEIDGDFALLHKKFDGNAPNADGSRDRLTWQTLYFCKRVDGRWKIRGFVGYMPYPLAPEPSGPAKQIPQSDQHVTAGPYSPVVKIPAGSELIVISGQVAIEADGTVVGDTVEDQARKTLENCQAQLAAAGATLEDVFKVNVFLHDIEEWGRFNTVYVDMMPKPFPARTAVQATLPQDSFRVEIEMWAARK